MGGVRLSLGLLLATVVSIASADYKVVCYYGSWAVYRPGLGKFDVEDIDPFLCTHLIYTFAGLDPHTHRIKSLDPWNDLYDNYGKGAFLRFTTGLKQKNPQLKTLLAIGGWNEGSETYSEMSAIPERRKTFVKSVVEFLRKYHFDGLDLDWEYPTQRGGKAKDYDSFAALVKELSDELIPEDLLLTAALSIKPSIIDNGYDMGILSRYLDLINIMTYDYHGSWDPFTGHVAPMYGSKADVAHGGEFPFFNVNYSINYFLTKGVPAEKLMLGMPLYGQGFLLDDPTQTGMYAPAHNPMPACPYTRTAGHCGFAEICKMLQEGGWHSVTDSEQQALYSFKDDVWIGYDDLRALQRKTDLIKQLGVGGAMMWSVETDDIHNFCGLGTQRPMMTAVWTALNGDIPSPSPAPDVPTTAASLPPTSAAPGPTHQPPPPSHICQTEGLNPDPDMTCSTVFYECEHVGANWRVTKMECAGGLVFDRSIGVCTWPAQAAECNNSAK